MKYSKALPVITDPNSLISLRLNQKAQPYISLIRIRPTKRELTSATTKCCADLYRRAKALTTTVLMTSYTLRIRSTTCPERFWATEPRKSCSSRNSTAYMLSREPRRREFSFPRSSLRSSLEKLAAIYYRLKNCCNLLLQFANLIFYLKHAFF